MQEEITLTVTLRDNELSRLLSFLFEDLSLNSMEALALLTDARTLLQAAECGEFKRCFAAESRDTCLDVSGHLRLRLSPVGILAAPIAASPVCPRVEQP